MKKRFLATVVAVLLVSVLVFWFFAEDIYTIHSDDTVGQMVTTVDIPDSSYPVEIRIDGKPVTVKIIPEGTKVTLTGIYAKCLFGDVINVIQTDYLVLVMDGQEAPNWVWATNLGLKIE